MKPLNPDDTMMLSFCPKHERCFWFIVKQSEKNGAYRYGAIGKWHDPKERDYFLLFYLNGATALSDYMVWKASIDHQISPWSGFNTDPRGAAVALLENAADLTAHATKGPTLESECERWKLSGPDYETLAPFIDNVFDVLRGKDPPVPTSQPPTETVEPDVPLPKTIVPKNVRMPNRACQCEHYLNSHGVREAGGRWMCFVYTCDCESYRYRCPECHQISQRGMRHTVDCHTGWEHEQAFKKILGEPIQPALRRGIALDVGEL